MPILQLLTGNESFGDGTVEVKCYVRSQSSEDIDLWTAVRDPRSGVSSISINNVPARAENSGFGVWIQGRYNVPDGVLVTIWIKRRVNAEVLYRQAVGIVIAREAAALRMIRVPFTGHQHADFACGYIDGRFDLIEPAQYEDLGLLDVHLPEYHCGWDRMAEMELATVVINEPEETPLVMSPMRTVETTEGEIVRISRLKPRRIIRLRRPTT